MSSETQIASADTVASDAQARAAEAAADKARRTRNRARRSATLLVLALGAGGTALGAVVVVATRGGGTEEAFVPLVRDGGYPVPSLQGAIKGAREKRWAIEDAGLGVALDDPPPPAPGPTAARPASMVHVVVPAADAAPPLPEWLDGYDVDHVLAATVPGVSWCNDEYDELLAMDVNVVVGGDGQVIDVQFPSKLAGKAISMCATRAIKDAQFPRFRNAAQEVPYTYEFAPLPPGALAPAVTPGGSVGKKPLRSASSATPPRP
jgi:hypothetical protein